MIGGKYFVEEEVAEGVIQKLQAGRVVYHDKSEHQDLVIFDHPVLGRVMTLDGVVQTTEFDEFVYHEMLTHVPILAHGRVKSVLIIGGGDGGMAEEALKHPIERLVQVEIDDSVVEISKTYLGTINRGCFDDARMALTITDGVAYMAEKGETFDVIIIDSTDPIGPGEVLFTESFYKSCRNRLAPGGVVVTQNGVPAFQGAQLRDTYERLGRAFADVWFYQASVPTYYGGAMTFGWASDDEALRRVDLATLHQRFDRAAIETGYYTPEVHKGAFALPRNVQKTIGAL